MGSILHISDIHVGPPHLPQLAGGVRDLVERRTPDLVVVSGDLTQRAKPYQFRQAREFLRSLEGSVLVVPGNHDVPMYRFWERLFAPFRAYRKHFSPQLETVHRADGLFVAGINTAHSFTRKHGKVRSRRLAELRRLGDELEPAVFTVIVAHHPLVRPELFGREPAVRGAQRAAEVFGEIGVELVLSGHMHQFFLGHSEDFFPELGHHFRILHAGTTTSRRRRGVERNQNSCNWIEFDHQHVEVQQLVWDGDVATFLEGAGAAWTRPTRATDDEETR